MTTMKRRCIAMSKPDRCIIESKLEQDRNQGSIFNLLATVPTHLQLLQQRKKRLVQYSAAGWNQIRLRCVSVPTSCSGGRGPFLWWRENSPKKFRSIYFLKVSRRQQVSGCCRQLSKKLLFLKTHFSTFSFSS